MSPFQLDILFWYIAHVEDHPVLLENPPIWKETRNKFLEDGLLQQTGAGSRACYELGERGRVFTDYICNLPLPRKVWEMP